MKKSFNEQTEKSDPQEEILGAEEVVKRMNEHFISITADRSPSNPTQALCNFVSWLASREKPITLSRKHSIVEVMKLVEAFVKENDLPPLNAETWPGPMKRPDL